MRGTNKITKLKNLVVREVSFVHNPAIADAKFVIVKEAEGGQVTDPKLLHGDYQEQNDAIDKAFEAGEKISVEKSPTQSGTCSLGSQDDPSASNEVIDDGGKAELKAVVKQLVDKAMGMPDDMQDLIAKIAKFHGIDPYTPEMLEAAKPKGKDAIAAAGDSDTPSTTKEMDQKVGLDPVLAKQFRNLFAEMMEEEKAKTKAADLNKSNPDPVQENPETAPETTGTEGSDQEVDILLMAAELLHKEECSRLQLAELESLNAQKEALNTSVGLLKAKSQELRREFLKAMGKDPNENSVIA